MVSQKQRKNLTARLTHCARTKYGDLKNRKARSPLNQLALSIFYHVTSVRRATRALSELKRTFVDWNDIRISHPVEVAAALSSSQWALDGAEKLVWVLRELYEVYNQTNLDFLAELTPAQARSCLKRLTMVQRELADEVLLLSLDVPVLPFSSDVARMCHRLGLVENDRPSIKNQRTVSKLFEEGEYPSLHLFFCDHAEKVCLPEEPMCSRCPMKASCPSAP